MNIEERQRRLSQQIDANEAAKSGSSRGKKNLDPGNRWARQNTFIDDTMGKLTHGELKIWMFLYRHERNGRVDSSVRQIAKGATLSVNHAQKAV